MKILSVEKEYKFPCEECNKQAIISIEVGGNSFELCQICFGKLVELLKGTQPKNDF